MTETAQGDGSAEKDVISTADALDAAASVFKASLGQADATPAPEGAGADHPDDAAAAEEANPDPDRDADDAAGDLDEEGEAEAAQGPDGEQAQPGDDDLPKSWPDEHAGLWHSLPADARELIRQRDAAQEVAVQLRFMEAANVKKAHEAELGEAQAVRRRYAEAVDQVMSLVVPQPPPRSMLDQASADYDPDAYHYRKALHEDVVAFLNVHAAQRQEIAAQDQNARFGTINHATRDAFVAAVPDIADQAKAPAIFEALIDYAVKMGTPAEVFDAPTTALEWHMLWKAREYDRLQAARARVQDAPKPAPRKPQPPLRPGVSTPRAAAEQTRRANAMERLGREGSIDAGAAAIKLLMKG